MLNLVRDVDWSLETLIFDKIGNSRLLKCFLKTSNDCHKIFYNDIVIHTNTMYIHFS